MMRNPFHKEHQFPPEQVDAAYAKEGWGTKVERRVPRTLGDSLYFQFRLPNDARCIEVSDLAASARDAPAWLAGKAAELRDVAAGAGAVLIGAICDQGDLADVLFTVTVLFSELPDAPAMQVPEAPPPEQKVFQHVELLSDSVTRVKRISAITLEPGAEPVGLLVDQYLARTPYGGMAFAFSTTHNGMLGAKGTNFFRGIVDNYWLGETPDPAPPS